MFYISQCLVGLYIKYSYSFSCSDGVFLILTYCSIVVTYYCFLLFFFLVTVLLVVIPVHNWFH